MVRWLVLVLAVAAWLQAPQSADPYFYPIEAQGEVLFVEPRIPVGSTQSQVRAASLPVSQIPLSEAFTLHSRPGAKKVIYLDFNGYDLAQTRWVKMSGSAFDSTNQVLEAFDSDGDSGNFSDGELQKIIDAWSTVAEDYSIFDVDVTTAQPTEDDQWRTSDADDRFGAIAAVTTENNPKARACVCAGVSWLNVFNRVWRFYNTTSKDYMQPAMVFTQSFYTGQQIGDIISHELGHNLGLSHDGTVNPDAEYFAGRDGWSPIMGTGYTQPLTTWNNGDYANSTNQQDDLAVLVSGGLTLISDDFGNSTAKAKSVRMNSTTPGFIGSRTDVDYFSFVATKTQTDVSTSSDSISTDLDTKISVFDSNGKLLQVADPAIVRLGLDSASGLTASVSIPTKVGSKYFVSIDGVGFGAMPNAGYSDYGSIGTYKLRVAAVDLPAIAPGVPIITGTNLIGSTLTADAGTWPQGAALTTSWFKNGIFTGITGSTYLVQPTDQSGAITCVVMASVSNFRITKVVSNSIKIVGPISPATTPKVLGKAKVGYTLHINKGNWKSGVRFSYQWLRNGVAIQDATNPTYLVGAGDVASRISVRLAAEQDGYNPRVLVSASTSKVGF